MYYSDPLYFIGQISEIKPKDLLAFQSQFHNIILRETIPGKVDYNTLKRDLEKWTDQFVMIDGIKAILEEKNAAILIRHSQSEPITRINVEAENLKIANDLFKKLEEIIKKDIS
jgi:phosphomannomutase